MNLYLVRYEITRTALVSFWVIRQMAKHSACLSLALIKWIPIQEQACA